MSGTSQTHHTSPPAGGTLATFNLRRALRAALTLVVMLPLAFVTTNASAAKTESITQVKKRIEALQAQVEQAAEAYDNTLEQLKSLQVHSTASKSRMVQQQQQVAVARTMLGRLAAEAYRAGDLSTLSLFLGDDPDNVLAQSGLVATLADRQVEAIRQLQLAEDRLAADTADVNMQQSKLGNAQKALLAQEKAAKSKVAAAEAELRKLSASQLRALHQAQRADDGGASVPVGSTCEKVGVTPPDARVAKVLAYACSHIGSPYVWAADGEKTFDCSGYTMRAWAQAGVSLPHSSRLQATYGTRVTDAQLRPGDLLFFHSPISHVGIYIGNGLMLHAPHSGTVVQIASARLGQLVAAVRL